MKKKQRQKRVIFTIGHSTHDLKTFIAMLKGCGINQVVDVRSIPRSRHNPQFNFDTLPKVLRNTGIGYRHEKVLGGLRRAKKDSINTAWHNASFRGFADYMQTDAFAQGIAKLIAIMRKKTLVIMCAEAVPWRCHRSLISDALVIRDIEVQDIFDFEKCKPHALTSWANLRGMTIEYPGNTLKKKLV